VLKRWATFPKTSVISAVSISRKLVSAPESTSCCREAMNSSIVAISGASELFVMSFPLYEQPADPPVGWSFSNLEGHRREEFAE
jgi:hypothetical protein